jgi:hypothetical protein
MKTKIISGFPGIGKTYFYENNKDITLDSDSSKFSWLENKTRNPEFPVNYIAHIKENIGKYEYILVSTHEEIRDALEKENIKYTIIIPNIHAKWDYIDRYEKRVTGKNDEFFISYMSEHWFKFLTDIQFKHENVLILPDGKFLSDVID